jgi:hypothetical protein
MKRSNQTSFRMKENERKSYHLAMSETLLFVYGTLRRGSGHRMSAVLAESSDFVARLARAYSRLMDWRLLKNRSMASMAAIYAVLFSILLSAGLVGLVLLGLLALSLLRYCYAVLRAAAQGKSMIPPPSIDTMNFANKAGLTAHFLVYVAVIAFIYRVLPWGWESATQVLMLVLMLATLFSFPASAALLILTSNPLAALNPVAIHSVIKTLGRDYFLLVGACFGLILFSLLAQVAVLSSFGPVARLVVLGLATWTVLALFALIGSSIHFHRDDFVIPGLVMTREELDAVERHDQWRATLDLAYASIRSGLVAEGYHTLRQLIAENDGSLDVQHWLFDQMLAWEDRRHALQIGARLVDRLVASGDVPRAFELYIRCRRVPGDLPIGPEAAGKLAAYARKIRYHDVADELNGRVAGRSSVPN